MPEADSKDVHGRHPSSGVTPGYAKYMVGLLTFSSVLNHIDRQLPAIMLPQIQADLHLSDTELGFITGLAFALFYSVMGIPIGRAGDVFSRRNVIAFCIALWSAMTAVSGLATNFVQMAAARFGVGFGEAGLTPGAHSLISDVFPPGRRATAMGFYSMGIPLGSVIAYLAGGWLTEFFGWRIAFLALGLPGIAVAIVVWLTIRETPRGHADGIADPGHAPPFKDVVKTLLTTPAFIHCMLGTSFTGLVYAAITTWAPSFLSRSFAMTTGEIGTWLAPSIGLGGIAGTVFGGMIADQVSAHDKRWMGWIPAITTTVGAALGTIGFATELPVPSVILIGLPLILCPVHLPIYSTILQGLAGVRMRGAFPALSLLMAGLIGLGIGPQMVGVASDLVKPIAGQESLRYALLLVVPFFGTWAGIHFYIGGKHLPHDFAKA
ncbi:MAG: MFS transporter, partial [Rhodobacteraceae bacterium]|nr:MFS transporter [Paracoccaceae bacterium]